jgi:hypothetical protein
MFYREVSAVDPLITEAVTLMMMQQQIWAAKMRLIYVHDN